MKRNHLAFVACLSALLGACQGSADDPNSAATTERGPITFAAVEQWLHAKGAGGTTVRPEELFTTFSDATKSLAVQALLVPIDEGERERAIAGLGQEAGKLRHRAEVELYRESRSTSIPLPTEAEIAAAFAADPARFRRPAQLFLWHLLLRVEPGVDPDTVVQQARELKQRIESGASFASVAREYSRSETRALGGRLGSITQGRLPPALEKIVFALGEGAVSEPVRTKEGVLLFQATDIIPEKNFTLDDVHWILARELFDERRRQALRDVAGEALLPADTKLLDHEALLRSVALGDAEVILRVADLEWTVGDLRREYLTRRAADPSTKAFLEEAPRIYADWVDAERTYRLAESQAFATEQATEIAQRQRARLDQEIAHRAFEERIAKLAAGRRQDLERHFNDNRFLYQTPLRVHLRMLSAPLGKDPQARLARLEAAQTELVAGRTTLDKVAREFAGTVQDAGWSSARDLEFFEPKVRYLIVDLGGTGYTVPFQFNQRIAMVQVVERQDPVARPFEEVAHQVLEDYLERHRQELYREAEQEVLRDGRFRLNEAAVRLRLGLPPRTGAG